MNIEAGKHCRKCGKSLLAEDKFCTNCGTRVEAIPFKEPVKEDPAEQVCPKCGQKAAASAKFCRKCGYKFEASAPSGGATQSEEFVLMDISDGGDYEGSPSEDIPESDKIASPAGTIFSAIASFFGGIFKSFASPKTLIPCAVLGILWTFLGRYRGSENILIRFLSWLTFAEGGFGRKGLGFLGGIAGKGVVGATLVSVFSGGISRFGYGFKALLNNKEKKSVAAMLFGWITGILLYISFAGLARASAATSLAGFAGAVLSVEALGEGEGWIYRIAQSLTAGKTKGIRIDKPGKTASLIGGMAAGLVTTALGLMVF